MKNTPAIRIRKDILNMENGLVMGILNLTPDSFYSGSRFPEKNKAKKQIDIMISEGVDILDIGAFSSRPGAELLSESEEWSRLQPILRLLRDDYPELAVSLDTYRADIAAKAILEYGVSIINDISSGRFDTRMPEVTGELKVPVILMHMQGIPGTMQENPVYENVVLDVIKFFSERIQVFRNAGVHDIILDPGFGFGKTLKHNYELLKQLSSLKELGFSVMAGISRKSMIYNYIGGKAEDALNGTTTLNALCRQNGADILRVHDVKEAVECLKLTNLVMQPELLT
ncbi:MAG: dihydropteroate synthase [Bacteroidota bacterium]|nr:dihydropteroate synthase [Bacteroidota bacterium]